MCRHLFLLGSNEQQQMIHVCEHGTIHLTHQQLTVSLDGRVFRQIATCVCCGDLSALRESGLGDIAEGPAQQVELWLGQTGLRLSVEDFFALSDLMRDALQRLDTMRLDAIWVELPIMQKSAHPWYSLN